MWPRFNWRGQDSDDFGLLVSELPAPTRAAERTENITIPGRAGVLTYKEGANVHEAYVKEVTVQAPAEADFAAILDWLTGTGTVIFSNEPDRVYFAHIAAEVRFDRVSNALKQAVIPFAVHPHKGQYPPETDIALANGGTVVNPGTVDSRPVIGLTFTGSTTITVNGAALTLHSPVTTETGIAIDAYEALDMSTVEIGDETIGDVTTGVFAVGNVALLDRPTVPMSELSEWTDETTGNATLLSQTYAAAGMTLHLTPIQAADSSSYTVLTKSAVETYVSALDALADSEAMLEYDAEHYGILIWVQTGQDGATFDESLSMLQKAYYFADTTSMPTADTLRDLFAITRPEGETPIDTTSTVAVDCDAQIITDADGIWRGASEGDFPTLQPGSNEITASVALTITPRWRWY